MRHSASRLPCSLIFLPAQYLVRCLATFIRATAPRSSPPSRTLFQGRERILTDARCLQSIARSRRLQLPSSSPLPSSIEIRRFGHSRSTDGMHRLLSMRKYLILLLSALPAPRTANEAFDSDHGRDCEYVTHDTITPSDTLGNLERTMRGRHMHAICVKERLLGTARKKLAQGTTQEGSPRDHYLDQSRSLQSVHSVFPSEHATHFSAPISANCSTTMFGSSQDRARQLAGRKRRERIASSGSNSTLRSSSSSSHAFQQYHSALALDPGTQQSAVIKENPRTLKGHHILQAEYLSQVLYSDLGASASVSADPPQSGFVTSRRHARYGSLEMLPAVTRHPRNVTAPLAESMTPNHQPLSQRAQHGVALGRSTSESHKRLQAAVSLRGGRDGCYTGDGTERREYTCTIANEKYDEKRNLPSRPFILEFPWVTKVYRHPQWHAPISSGASYEAFIDSLSTTELERFRDLFGKTPGFLPASLATARQAFFMTLTGPQQRVFKNIIISKGMALLAMTEEGVGVQCSIHTVMCNSETKPAVMLEYLLEATERPVLLLKESARMPRCNPIRVSTLSIMEEAEKAELITEYEPYAFLSTAYEKATVFLP